MPTQTRQGEVGSKDSTTTARKQQPTTTKSNNRKDSAGDEQDDGNKRNASNCTEFWEDEGHFQVGQEEYRKFKESQAHEGGSKTDTAVQEGFGSDESDVSNQAKKRGRGANSSVQSLKKQKNGGDADAAGYGAGDKTRVPRKGQVVQWEDSGEVVDGEVVEVIYEEKEVAGEAVKASREEPQIVLRSKTSGQTVVQDPANVKFA